MYDKQIADLESRIAKLEGTRERPVVKFLQLHPKAQLPQYKTVGAAGMDLYACIDKPITLWPGEIGITIPLGFAMELPDGYEAQIRSRSGLSIEGVCVANSPGTIDSDFRAECKVILVNHGKTYVVRPGDRIAQMVISQVVRPEIVLADELVETERGAGGFGSTGK